MPAPGSLAVGAARPASNQAAPPRTARPVSRAGTRQRSRPTTCPAARLLGTSCRPPSAGPGIPGSHQENQAPHSPRLANDAGSAKAEVPSTDGSPGQRPWLAPGSLSAGRHWRPGAATRAQLPTCVHAPTQEALDPHAARLFTTAAGHMPPVSFCNGMSPEHANEGSQLHESATTRPANGSRPEDDHRPGFLGPGVAKSRRPPLRRPHHRSGFTPTRQAWTPPVTSWCGAPLGSGRSAHDPAARISRGTSSPRGPRSHATPRGPPLHDLSRKRSRRAGPEVPSAVRTFLSGGSRAVRPQRGQDLTRQRLWVPSSLPPLTQDEGSRGSACRARGLKVPTWPRPQRPSRHLRWKAFVG